jgi:hypothetical protein
MARTFLQLQQQALGVDFDPAAYQALVKEWINEAVHRVARRAKLRTTRKTFSPTLVAGTGAYSLPSDFVRLLSLRNTTDAADLQEVDVDDIDNMPAGSSKPSIFAQDGQQLVLYPTPDRAYALTLRYEGNLSFVNDTDTTDTVGFPDDYADLLVTYARSRLFRAEDDFEAAGQYMGEFNAGVAELKGDLQLLTRGRPKQVPSMFDRRPAGPRFQVP